MRRVRYVVAMSLDGYIVGPNGEVDWIIMDPDIDFRALFDQFDTSLLGRRTFEGIPLLPTKPSSERFKLKLACSRAFETGIVSLAYALEYEPA
jgi:dihydrofolate reductase